MKIFFNHIPKCAGTSIHSYLDQSVDLKRICPNTKDFQNWIKNKKIENKTPVYSDYWKKYTLYHEHVNIIDTLDDSWELMTFLRSPEERVSSLFHHWKSWSHEEILGPGLGGLPIQDVKLKVIKGDIGIVDLINMKEPHGPSYLFNNGMSKALIGTIPGGIEYVNNMSDDELFEKAMTNLRRMKFIGVTEFFKESILLMQYKMNLFPNSKIELENVRNSNLNSFSNDEIDEIKKACRIDRMIYKEGLKLFNGQVLEMNEEIKIRKTYNYLNVEYQRKKTIEFISDYEEGLYDKFNICMDEALDGRGFHIREGMDINCVYRWAGPDKLSYIDFPIKKSDNYYVRFHVISIMEPAIIDNLKLSINDGPITIGLEFLKRDTQCEIYEAVVSGVNVKDDFFARLKIYSNQLLTHEDINPGCGDKRKKSLAIHKVEVFGK